MRHLRILMLRLLAAWVALVPVRAAAAPGQPWDGLIMPLFSHLTVANGLPYPIAMSLAQDSEGFLWIGTPGGLARWDGYRMQVYRQDIGDPHSLPENIVPRLLVDERGTLWVGTISGLVARYDRERNHFVTYRENGSGLGWLGGMASDGEGGLWAIGQNRLLRLDTAKGTWTRFDQGVAEAGSILRDRTGTVWLGTSAGPMRRNPGAPSFEAVASPGGPPPSVTALFEDSRGAVWFGTAEGQVGVVDRAAGTAALRPELSASGYPVSSLAEPLPGMIWAGEFGGGLRELEVASGDTRVYRNNPTSQGSLADDSVNALMLDRSGLIWVAHQSGIDRYDPSNAGIGLVMPDLSDGLLGRDVRSVAAGEDGLVWLGFRSEGVALYAPTTGLVEAIRTKPGKSDTLPRRRVQALAPTPGGDLWVGLSRGLYRIDGATRRTVALPALAEANIRALRLEHRWLWVGSNQGLARIQRGRNTVRMFRSEAGRPDSLSDNVVLAILRDRDGRLWVGTQRGLNLFDPSTEGFRRFLHDRDDSGSLPNDVVTALVEDRRGRIWIATANGIGILDPAEGDEPRIRHVSTADGLPHDTVTVLLEGADGAIWAGTGDGIAAIDPQTLAVRSFGPADGAGIRTTWQGAGASLPDGTLLFGGVGGLTVARPHRLTRWVFRPPVVATAARVGERPVIPPAWPSPLVVQPDDRGFEVEFAALDFSAPEKNRYQYRLDGYDSRWVDDSGQRKATYTHLAPGRYELWVRGSNRDGTWSEPPLRLAVEIRPAWHQTTWFHGLAVAATMALVWVIIQGRTTYLQRRQRELEYQVALRTEELEAARSTAIAREEEARRAKEDAEAADAAKSRFLAVASHEIRTPLNGILGLLQLLDARRLNDEQHEYLEVAKSSGRSLIGLLDSMLEYGRHEADSEVLDAQDFDLRGLLGDAAEMFRRHAVANGVLLRLEVDPRVPAAIRCDRVRLTRIVHNLLGNAIKFTPKGMVELSAEFRPGRPASTLTISVADTGIGIAPEMCDAVFKDFVQADDSIARRFGGTGLGLAICRRAARLMGGTLSVDSAVGLGSTFVLTIPVEAAAPPPQYSAAASGAGLSVLLVDDDAVNRIVGSGMLRKLGHRVTEVEGGEAAVQAAAARDFDFVLLDLHMPGIDGIEACRRIRALPDRRRAAVPIVAVTADLTLATRERCVQAGMDRFLGKPLLVEALETALTPLQGPDLASFGTLPAARDGALVDAAFLANQWEILGTADLIRLGRTFHRASRSMIGIMETAAATGDRATVRAVAHRLCSSAGAMGLDRMAAACKAIETGAESLPESDLLVRVAELRDLRRASLDALTAAARSGRVTPGPS